MALHLHLGSAGTGKTTGLHSHILKEASGNIGRSFLIVVPEQFTLQTQREIINKSENGGMLNIDVLSFARLSHRVFEELGITMLPVLEDTGKGMIVKKVAEENRDRLTVYRSKVSNRGFIEEMKSLIAEFYQYRIDSKQLKLMMELARDRKQLEGKLKDISVLYDAFAEFINGRFCMNEEITDRLCEVAEKSRLLRESTVAFDCFTGFTPSQYNCIRTLMKMSSDIHVALTISPTEAEKAPDGQSLFDLSRKTIMKLEKMAAEAGVNVVRHIYEADGRFAKNPVLGHLEKQIFRFPYIQRKYEYTEIPPLRIVACDTKEQEMQFVMAGIRKLVFEHNYRYQDIAIVTGDVGAYEGVVRRASETAGIPLFVDEKKSIKNTTVVELLEAALEIVRSNYSYDSVFRFLKTNLTGIDADGISLLENYVIRCGIRGRAYWNREWRLSQKNSDISEEVFARIIKTKNAFIELISCIEACENGSTKAGINEIAVPDAGENGSTKTGINENAVPDAGENGKQIAVPAEKAATETIYINCAENNGNPESDGEPESDKKWKVSVPTVRERLTALYSLLEKCDVEEQLYIKAQMLEQSPAAKDRVAGKEKSQLFRLIIDVFNRIDGLMSEERMSLKEFSDILDTGFNEAKLRNIPGGADSLVLGDIERTRLSDKKIIFFMGVNDNVIPKQSGPGGILSDYDRSLFEEHNIELSPTKKENAYLSEFYLYLALTRPSDALYMTFAKTGSDEKEARPAYIIGRLKKIFDGLKTEEFGRLDRNDPYLVLGADRGMTMLTESLRMSGTMNRGKCAEILLECIEKENKQLASLLKKASEPREQKKNMLRETAEKLYGESIKGSVTRLQNFASCAFMHYLKYGLGIKERDIYRLSGLEIGNIYHKALETYGTLVNDNGLSWRDVNAEQREVFEEKAVKQSLEEYIDVVESTDRNRYFRERLKRVLDRSVDIITKQISAGSFDVKYLEKSFNHTNRYLSLTGKIDRIDTVCRNGKTYIRVIDYKSGSQKFDLNRLYHGLQLQLGIYLREAENMLAAQGETVAAGMYYYKVDDPILDAGGGDPEMQRMKYFRLDGLSGAEADVLGLHDVALAENGELTPGAKSEVLGIDIKKDGSLDRHAVNKVLKKEKMQRLGSFVAEKTTELTEKIREGCADINPYEYDKKNPCGFCEFADICGFDKRKGDSYRSLEKNAAEKIFADENPPEENLQPEK